MGAGIPLRVERQWVNDDGVLALRFTLVNSSNAPVEIGALGMPMVFDNIILDRDLDQAHAQASFVDPYIGNDAGYLQVTRLNGRGPALLVLPDGRTPRVDGQDHPRRTGRRSHRRPQPTWSRRSAC